MRARFGHEFNAFHRVDLHEGLRKMAEGLGVTITLGMAVVDVNCEDGVIGFKSGESVSKDLVVIAGGIKVSHCSSSMP